MERILLSGDDALPMHINHLGSDKLASLIGLFMIRKQLELPAVELLQSNEGLIVLNGHHRLTCAMLYEVGISGLELVTGDIWHTTLGDLRLSEKVVENVVKRRTLAKEIGHDTFADLYRLSFPRNF